MTQTIAYDYIKMLLEQEFISIYLRFLNQGILHYELTNIIELCAPLLEGLDEDLRYEVLGTIAIYLKEE